MSTAVLPYAYPRAHGILERFRAAVWGSEDTFKQSITRQLESGSRTVDCLEFGEHLDAVRLFCNSVRLSRLLIVEEYRLAMKNLGVEDGIYANGACILGQPGIACFIVYAVIERLRSKKPVAVQLPFNQQHYVLFSEDGVTISDSVPDLEAHPGIWAFSDCNSHIETPVFVRSRAFQFRGRVFQTTPPERRRYEEWTANWEVRLYIMDVWSDEEIFDFAHISGYETKRATDLIKKWGPVPLAIRALYRMDGRAGFRETNAIEAANMAVLGPKSVARGLVHFTGLYAYDIRMLTLFVMKPEGKDIDGRTTHCVVIPTHWLTCLVLDTVANLGQGPYADERRAKFFQAMSICAAGNQLIKEAIRSHLDRVKEITVHWYDQDMKSPQKIILVGLQSVNLKDMVPHVPSYWLPEHSDIPGIDGVLVTADCVYLLQETTSGKQRHPQEGMGRMWESAPALHVLPWRFLFIGVTDGKIREVSDAHAHTLKSGVGAEAHLPAGRVSIKFLRDGEFQKVPGGS